jgi:large subunit ribosomal protein L10
LAFTKKHKGVLVEQYTQWLRDSEAVLMLEYSKMTMKSVDDLRAKVRETGSRAHVVKNTLFEMASKQAGFPFQGDLKGTTLVGISQTDVAALAKVFADAAKDPNGAYKLKGGFVAGRQIKAEDIKALADLPPLPVMRAKLLGVLQAPAAKLVRTLAEPGRRVAAVVKAYSEKAAPAA